LTATQDGRFSRFFEGFPQSYPHSLWKTLIVVIFQWFKAFFSKSTEKLTPTLFSLFYFGFGQSSASLRNCDAWRRFGVQLRWLARFVTLVSI
jgi:hypothetical protein